MSALFFTTSVFSAGRKSHQKANGRSLSKRMLPFAVQCSISMILQTVPFYDNHMYGTFADTKRFCRTSRSGVILYHIQPQRNRPFLRQSFQSNPLPADGVPAAREPVLPHHMQRIGVNMQPGERIAQKGRTFAVL